MSDLDRIRITHDDAYHPKVDEVLAREGSFGMRPDQMAAMMSQGKKATSFFLSSIFYTAVAGALGACLGWAIVEPFIGEEQIAGITTEEQLIAFRFSMALFDISSVAIAAAFIGGVEALFSRNWGRMLLGTFAGFGIGAAGAAILWLPEEILFGWLTNFSGAIGGAPKLPGDIYDMEKANMLGKTAFAISRAIAWAPMGLVVGLGPALIMRSGKLAFNGIVGGLIGAFLGGLLFNPLGTLIGGEDGSLSRGVGFTLVGLGAGVMIGLVENLAKTAWLHVQAGALSGKQFILYKNPTVLGSSPKCEIYLFKDEAIEPKHAAIHAYGTRYEIEDLDSPAGTFVNGRKVTRQPLKTGDRIYIGETVLDFSEKESG